jgi:hypothetical protein
LFTLSTSSFPVWTCSHRRIHPRRSRRERAGDAGVHDAASAWDQLEHAAREGAPGELRSDLGEHRRTSWS